uniref:NmrA-like domain-containing protein n=1 Tax=Gibberella zeae TaxID=5518 RepID=A0A4E9E781_GIBZA
MQIGIFPASGALGTSTYTHLLSQVPNDKVTLINRYPEKVPKKYIEKGTTVRQASCESSAEDLEAVFSGVDVLFLISYPSHVHEYRTKVHTKAIDAAVKAGVKHVFYSSLGFASLGKDFTKAEVMGAHLDSEKRLKELAERNSGFTFTSVREGLYSESFPIYTSFLDLKNPPSKVLIPHDGSGPGVSWVKRDELGEGTARLIASYVESPSNFGYINKIVTLTGTKSFSLAETMEVLSRAAGKHFEIQQISVEEYTNLPQIKEYFGTEEKATTWATAWEAIRAGETAGVTTTLKELLGREPESFEKTIGEFVEK